MDIATIIGIVGAAVLILLGIMLGGSSIGGFIDPTSIVIVCGGTGMSLLVAYPLPRVKELIGIIRKAFFQGEFDAIGTIDDLVKMCTVVRREGLLALDGIIGDVADPFLQKGAQFVVDGTDPEMTRVVLETDISSKRQRHLQAKGMLEFLGGSAPAFGMIGTLIGLVSMLGNLDPSTLGPKMAVALLTTFYGSVLANVVFIPMSKKLEEASGREVLVNRIMIEGLLGIQAGENPRNLEDKLKAFLPVPMREKVGASSGGPDTGRAAAA